MIRTSSEREGMLAAGGAALLFGAAYPATAFALRSFSPLGAAAIQGTAGLGILLLLVRAGVLSMPLVRSLTAAQLVRLAVLGLLGGVAFTSCMNIAISLAGPTITSFVATLYAVLATLFAVPLLGERVRPIAILALIVALLGTLLLAGVDHLGQSLAGTIIALGAAVSFGLYLVLARRWRTSYGLDGPIVAVANLAARGPLLLVIELLREPARIMPAAPDPTSVAAVVFLAIGPSAVAQLLVLASVKRVPSRQTSALLLLTPVAAAVTSALLLGERLTPIELVGAGLVLAGIAGAGGAIELLTGRLRPVRVEVVD